MSWILIKRGAEHVWRCTSYTDLRSLEINNLAEWGQPFSPYQPQFNHDFYDKHVNFEKVIVEMPQSEVMIRGYGGTIEPQEFPVVAKFLAGEIQLKDGTYSFQDLLKAGLVTAKERFLKKSLYGRGNPGAIDAADAAYVHGSVGFALMATSTFVVVGKQRTINAEIGALDDNWDFESGDSLANFLNPVVEALVGPGNNNLKKPIQIRFFGSGVLRVKASTTN